MAQHPEDGSASHLILSAGSSSSGGHHHHAPHPEYPVGDINFVAQGKAEPSKFCIIHRSSPIGPFAEHFFTNVCKLERPKVLISVTGGAQDFKMLSSKLEQVFNRGLLRAAQNSKAWIVTGGLDSGVMEFVGDAVREQDATNVPCIGVASYKMVSHWERLAHGGLLNYSPEKPNDRFSAALNPDHSHFILVDSAKNDWGEEIEFRSHLEDYVSREWKVPLVLVAVNGGPGTLQTVAEGVEKQFPTIIVDGSGRACDAMSSYLRNKLDKLNYPKREAWDALISSIKPDQQQKFIGYMQRIEQHHKYITIFNPNEDATSDMDKAILRSILTTHENSGFSQKLGLGVDWGRADLILELLERDDTSLSTQDKITALNKALQKALKLDKPEIFELLVSKGAEKSSINLNKLYGLPDVSYSITRLKPFAGLKYTGEMAAMPPDPDEQTPLVKLDNSPGMRRSVSRLNSKSQEPPKTLSVVKGIMDAISPIYGMMLIDEKVTFTDILVWAILSERVELAKAIWRQTSLPVHSALVACHIYSTLGNWFSGDEQYEENYAWFEEEAIKVLGEMSYDAAKPVLEWKWTELSDTNALEISEMAECKEFYAASYVQRYLDEKLYSDELGCIPPGTSILRCATLCILPFLILASGNYEAFSEETRFYHFYNLPLVKFITSTMMYIGFLVLLAVNIVNADPHDFSILPHEIVLWIFIWSSILEEFAQYLEDSEGYFGLLTNQMDLTMYFQLVAYNVLRVLSWKFETFELYEAYTDVLIIATIICYVRLANVFAFSKNLGPLFFVIMRLFNDVGQWLFIFALFGMSFQLAFFALTRQADYDPWITYPDGTLGIGFSVVIGDTGDNTMEWLQGTHIGVIMLSLFALIVQVMLVNLLIAMMGDTYGAVKENSDKEWKFYRYSLVTDYVSSSPYPPPFNLIFGPVFTIKSKFDDWCGNTKEVVKGDDESDGGELDNLNGAEGPNSRSFTRMKVARERVLEKEREEDLDTLHTVSHVVREHMRLLTQQRDSDRLYLEHNMKDIESSITALKSQIDAIAAKLGAGSAPAGAPASPAIPR